MTFDPIKYQGQWYEIGRYPYMFEADCTGAIAYYTLEENGISVHNICLKDKKAIRDIYGFVRKTDNPMIFSLQFEGIPFTSTYRILETDYEKYSFVGSLVDNYYYILSRKPKTTTQEIRFFYDKTREFGFDPSKVEINPDVI